MRHLSWLAKQLKDNAPREREEELPKPVPETITASVAPAQPQLEAPPSDPPAPGNPDPRPDLTTDHVLWVTLLFVARRMDIYIRGLLWCARYLGAGAEYDGKTVRITPGQVSPEDYAQIRAEWMQPHRERIVRVLEEAVKVLQQAGVTGAIGGAVSSGKQAGAGAGQAGKELARMQTAQPVKTTQPDFKEVLSAAGRPQEPKVVQAALL